MSESETVGSLDNFVESNDWPFAYIFWLSQPNK